MKLYLPAFILVLFLFAGCTGANQQEFDQLKETNADLQSQIAALQTEKNDLSMQVSALQAQVDELGRLNKTAVKSKIEKAKAEISLYLWLRKNVFTDNPTISGPASIIETSRKIDAIDKPALTAEWDRFIECSSEREEDCPTETFMSMILTEAQEDIDSALSEVE